MRYLYIAPGGFVTLRDEAALPLDKMQDLLGGYLEHVWSAEQRAGEPRLVVIVNEEGLLLNLAPSVRFPQVYSVGGVLRGPVIIMAIDEHGDQTDLTDEQLGSVSVRSLAGDSFPTLHIEERAAR